MNIMDIIRTIFFIIIVAPYTVLISISIIFAAKILKNKKLGRKAINLWGKILIIITGAKVKIQGLDKLDKTKNYVFCANHTSAFDIYLLSGYLPFDFIWISKKAYFKIPIIGQAMKSVDHISMDRKNARKDLQNLKLTVKRMLDNNLSIVIFPEGTRSLDGKLKDFKRGSLFIASKSQIPIVPVSIVGTFNILPKGKYILKKSDIKIKIHSPIDAPEDNKQSQIEILNKLKNIIQQGIEDLNKE